MFHFISFLTIFIILSQAEKNSASILEIEPPDHLEYFNGKSKAIR